MMQAKNTTKILGSSEWKRWSEMSDKLQFVGGFRSSYLPRPRQTEVCRTLLLAMLWSMLLSVTVCSGALAQTPAVKVDSETISGLGARNIGSATMSGRIAALDAVQEGKRLTIY